MEIQPAGMPTKTIVSAAPTGSPRDFGLKLQSAMSGIAKNVPAPNSMSHKIPLHHSPEQDVSEPQIAGANPPDTILKTVRDAKNRAGTTGAPEATVADKAAILTAALPVADLPGSKIDRESNQQVNVPAIPAGQPSKQKRDGRTTGVRGTACIAESGDTQLLSFDAAKVGPQEIVAAAGQEEAPTSAWPGGGPAPALAFSALGTSSTHTEAEARMSDKARATPSAIVAATAASTGSPAPISSMDSSTKHSASCGSATPMPAGAHVSVDATGVSATAIPHAGSVAPPDAASRAALATPLPSGARLSAQLDHPAIVQAAGIGDRQMIASGPARLDVGVFDGTHGWLRIRAELDSAGAVNASLTASVSAHSSLKSALPEIANYLSSEAVGVSRIAVHKFDGSNNATPEQSKESGAGFGSSRQGGQEPKPQKQHRGEMESTSPHIDVTASIGPLRFPGVLAGMNGGWLNVCA